MTEAAEIVAVENLHKSFDDLPILRGIDLTIAAGDLVSIIGPSGCGKSTLLRCLNFIEIPDSGRVAVAGVASVTPWERGGRGQARAAR